MASILNFGNKTLESASASFMLSITDLFGPPIGIQGFAPDDMFDFGEVKPTHVVMGVDGTLSGGMVYQEIVQKIHLSPDSPSIALFNAWYTAQQSTRKAYAASAVVKLPGVGLSYICSTGWLTGFKPVADLKKILAPQDMEITWQNVQVVPIA